MDVNNPDADKFIKVRLEQNTDTLEMLSLTLNAEDAYQAFNADYGVLVGRVIANDGIGIPNAKVSIFIPLSEEDENNSTIRSLYPYKSPADKNREGKRYNLLPRVAEFDTSTGSFRPKQPFGSFPTKPEIVTNKNFLDVYKKYYKFSTTTNSSGDYMIFGAPVGLQTIHLSVDITDIGDYSMTPPVMVTELGYSPNLFTENNTKIKPSNDLTDLPNIETQEISVDIRPFWGDRENFEIGITRQDFRIRAQLVNTFTVFGSVFTDGALSTWGGDTSSNHIRAFYRTFGDTELRILNVGIESKRIGTVRERIFHYPINVSDDDIDDDNVADDGSDFMLLDQSEYSSIKRNGDFIYIIKCDRKKVVTNEIGELVDVADDFPGGIFTEFRGFMTFEYDDLELPLEATTATINGRILRPVRSRVKVPQQGDLTNLELFTNSHGLVWPLLSNTPNWQINNAIWRKQHKVFKGSNLYTVARFHGTVYNNLSDNEGPIWPSRFMAFNVDQLNNITIDPYRTPPVIQVNDDPGVPDGETTDNDRYEFPSNGIQQGSWRKLFGANWLNFSLHLPQFSRLNPTTDRLNGWKCATVFTTEFRNLNGDGYPGNRNAFQPNNEPLSAGILDTSLFLRSDLHWTDFVKVDRTDISKIIDATNVETNPIGKGFTNHDLENVIGSNLDGEYRNGTRTFENDERNIFNNKPACPLFGGMEGGTPAGIDFDPLFYFYRGHDTADCVQFLRDLGLG